MLAVGILEALFLGALLFVQADRAGAQTTTPPVVSNIVATSTTPTTANVTWMTDIAATAQVAYGTTTAYGTWSAYNPVATTSHAMLLSGLMSDTLYHFQVRSAGTSTATTTSANQTFRTMASVISDTTAPVISALTASATTTSATISWMTNEPTTMQVSYGTTSAYTASSTLNSTLMTSHTVTLLGLSPNTTYHFQARSADAAGNMATSTDQTFMTTTSTSADTTAPTISSIMATPSTTGATVSWMTNEPSTTQVRYGLTSAYAASSTLNSTLTTNHSVALSGLASSTTYHFQVLSADATGNMATSSDQMFMTTSTATTTPDFAAIQAEINRLWQKIAELMTLIQQLIAGGGGGNNNNSGSPWPPYTPTKPAVIDQNGATVEVGRSINFLGHQFGREEDVAVTNSGTFVKRVHADGGGNFSTGSMSVPNIPGTYTYTFTGQESGRSASATIMVTPED